MWTITRISIENYKSIRHSQITLGQQCFIVGRNATGKSNLLDIIDFIGDALYEEPDSALRDRGGLSNVITKSHRSLPSFSVAVNLLNPDVGEATYGFEIARLSSADYTIHEEFCNVNKIKFLRRNNKVQTTLSNPPPVRAGRLYLTALSGTEPFNSIFEFFTNLAIYSPSVEEMRKYQPIDNGSRLAVDAWNCASVLRRLTKQKGRSRLHRVERYLSAIAPAIRGLRYRNFGAMETVEFIMADDRSGTRGTQRFFAQNMSDGTLRALAILLALFQDNYEDEPVQLVGIEEPETGLHPAATSVIYDAIREAAAFRQIIVTSHSPEFLDRDDIPEDSILTAEIRDGTTDLRSLGDAPRSLIRKRLFTVGELLRRDQLEDASTIEDLDD